MKINTVRQADSAFNFITFNHVSLVWSSHHSVRVKRESKEGKNDIEKQNYPHVCRNSMTKEFIKVQCSHSSLKQDLVGSSD